jgi:formylglycine-generating enzyme
LKDRLMIRKLELTLLVSSLCGAPSHAVTFDWAHVGNPGNVADTEVMVFDGTTGYGSVAYSYRISKHEVTNAQYTEFLNAVAATDPYELYSTEMASTTWGGITRSGTSGSYSYAVKPAVGSYAYDNKPVVFVSFIDAMRFVNWLHNNQGAGDTETGVYNISDGLSETRSPNAKYWIPSEDEWYKAAYHDASAGTAGVYFDYPTGINLEPNNNEPSADTGNSANFDRAFTTGGYPLTDVGAYSLSISPYRTFDQGGNVAEWNEGVTGSSARVLRGGSWDVTLLGSDLLRASHPRSGTPDGGSRTVGFRVAAVPEPNSVLMAALAAIGLLMRKRA